MAEKAKEPTESEGERGTKAERGRKYAWRVNEGMERGERKTCGGGGGERVVSAFLLVQNRCSAVHVHPEKDRRTSSLIEIPSAALHRLLIGGPGGGEVGLQWSSAHWAVDDSRCCPPLNTHLGIMTLLCTLYKVWDSGASVREMEGEGERGSQAASCL